MELLLEILFEVIVGGCMEGSANEKLPKSIRIGLLVFATLIYIALTLLFVWLLCTSESVIMKVLSAVVVLMFVGAFVVLWRKALKVRK